MMNDLDFQSGDFLDTLFTGNDHVSATPSSTAYDSRAATSSSLQNTYQPDIFQTSANNNPANKCEVKKESQSFPQNFYAEVDYDDHANVKTENAEGAPPSADTSQGETTNQYENEQSSQNDDDLTVDESQPEIDIVINNVVSSFATRCHINLKRVAMEGAHCIYKRANGMVSMKLRKPKTTASIWSSGKITCTGATSEEESKVAARRFCRILQKMGFNIRFCKYRVVNVLGTCTFPFGIKINQFSRDHKQNASYEPELHPGVTYKIKEPKATLKIFSTGSLTVTAPSVANVQLAIEHIFPLVVNYRMEDKVAAEPTISSRMHMMPSHRGPPSKRRRIYLHTDSDEEDDDDDELGSSDFDSDGSQD